MRKVTLYFKCRWSDIRRIQQKFGFNTCVDVNGETCKPVEVKDDDWELLKETERRGYIEIRYKKDKI